MFGRTRQSISSCFGNHKGSYISRLCDCPCTEGTTFGTDTEVHFHFVFTKIRGKCVLGDERADMCVVYPIGVWYACLMNCLSKDVADNLVDWNSYFECELC